MHIIQHFIISFPRSGQHMMERVLESMYQYYNIDFSYCEYYNCCQQIPCKYQKKFQKNHDFDLTLNIDDRYKYLVLYREDYIQQLEALFRLNCGGDIHRTDWKPWKEVDYIQFDYTDEKVLSRLIEFVKKSKNWHSNFKKKWVENDYQNCWKVEYNDFLKYPEIKTFEVLKFLNPGIRFDYQSVQNIINNRTEKISYKNKINIDIYHKIKEKLEDNLKDAAN